jgi:hypothetical protein
VNFADYLARLRSEGWSFHKRPHIGEAGEPIVAWRLIRPNSENYIQGWITQAALRMAEASPGALDVLWLATIKGAHEACP